MPGPITLLFARSLENPNVSLDSEAAREMFHAVKSTSGVAINHETALRYAAVWAAVNRISRDIAKLPLFTYRRTDDDGKERAPQHPAYRLLRYKPNSEMTAMVYWQTKMGHVLLVGNGYGYISRDGAGKPEALILLNPNNTYPVRVNGVLWYITQVNGQERKLRAEDVLHIKGLGFDGLMGHSVISMARNSLGLGLAIEEYGSRFFSNNASPGILLEHPAKLGKDAQERLVKSWNEMHSGLDKAHKTAVLEEGMKAHAVSISARDSQLIESRQFENRQVANWFMIAPHKIGDSTRTSYASLEQENRSYLDETLDGWLVSIESECREKLLTEQEKDDDTHFVEFKREAFLRADLAARTSHYQVACGRPWLSPNEVRSIENIPRSDDPQMDTIARPLNLSVEPADEDEPEHEPEDEEMAARRAVLLDGLSRMVCRLGFHARKAAKHSRKFLDWLAGMQTEHFDVIAMALFPGVNLACVETKRDPHADSEMLVRKVCETVHARLSALCDSATADELPAAVDAAMKMFESTLPASIEGEYHATWK